MSKRKKDLNTIYISERMQESLRNISNCPLTAVVAPMGYGKTTAVSWYLREKSLAEDADVIRISIYSDNRQIFWKSTQKAFAIAGFPLLSEYEFPAELSDSVMLAEDICSMFDTDRACYIFIDDFHLLGSQGVVSFLCMIAKKLPENVHIIIAGRSRFLQNSDIVQLGRKLHEINADQFRLNYTELSVYAGKCGISMNDSQLDRLMHLSEGWFSAVYIQLRSMEEYGDMTGETLDIYEMFNSALIDPLEEELREFIAVMSIADEFSLEMAEYITQNKCSEEFLRKLTESNAFVRKLAGGNGYRFHHMLKTCAGRIFSQYDKSVQEKYLNRYGRWHELRNEYIRAMMFYERIGNRRAWLGVVAEDAGVMLACLNPSEVIETLQSCTADELKENPYAILVLMRRLFSWGNIPKMLELKELLTEAVKTDAGLTQEQRENLLGECDLIMSFLCYNDIEGMSRLHQSACSKMTHTAQSIKTYGSFTFGSPSVLMMFHRTVGNMKQEVAVMENAMPFYYKLTDEHGAGAELVMSAEEAFMRGELAAAGVLLAKAEYRAAEKHQNYLLQCCDFIRLRKSLFDGSEYVYCDSSEIRKHHDTMLMLVNDSVNSYYYALAGICEHIPDRFAEHHIESANILNPAVPMMQMIENQVYLAQGSFETVIARSEKLMEMCRRLNYVLVGIHIQIQTAAAYEMLGMRDEASAMLEAALKESARDWCIIPAAENYRYIGRLVREFNHRDFADQIEMLGEKFEANCTDIRNRICGSDAIDGLTDREMQIAKMAAERMSNREIAAALFLSEGTVKQYVNRIYSKLEIEGNYSTRRKQLAEIVNKKNQS